MAIHYVEAEIPFPTDIPTAELPIIDFELVKAGDDAENERLWTACTGVSFVYLKNTGVDPQPLVDLGKTTFSEKLEEKKRFPQGDTRYTFGYKSGFYDGAEIMNVGEDAVGNFLKNEGGRVAIEACDSILAPVQSFMSSSRQVAMTLLNVFEKKLGLQKGSLTSLHEGAGGSGARITMTPVLDSPATEAQIESAEHADFGTLAILFDNVGGLQIQIPGETRWEWMKPIAGYASVNTGDYLAALTGGKITSLRHRVLPPPGEQAALTRFSPVYFCRPNWGVKAEKVQSILTE